MNKEQILATLRDASGDDYGDDETQKKDESDVEYLSLGRKENGSENTDSS